MTASVVDLSAHKRKLGMIATSGSWRRHWLKWRAWRYPLTAIHYWYFGCDGRPSKISASVEK